jgi:hypothetical protein
MESLLARYFDGDLSDEEARELLEASEKNPSLERELRAYERVLTMARALPSPRVPAGFTARVMAGVKEAAMPERARGRLETLPRFFRPQWVGGALAAAVVIVAFAGGLWTGRGLAPAPIGGEGTRVASETTGPAAVPSAVLPAATATGAGVRYVRLVYVPRETNIESVAVAGSFNGWDPASIPLRREDGVWSTILVLPTGSYEYMFVENGQRWVTDPLAARTRDDGFGTMNAVLDVEL